MSAEARMKELGLVLPGRAKPVANYLPYRLATSCSFRAKAPEMKAAACSPASLAPRSASRKAIGALG